MSTLMQASNQWATRPAEERFDSLTAMQDAMRKMRGESRALAVSSRKVQALPDGNKGLLIAGPSGSTYAPTNWAFGQLSTLIGAPASYLRTLPAPMAADCINYGLQVERDAMDMGVLLNVTGAPTLRAATGPRYGRIWNHQVVDALVDHFGDGITGQWHVPGEFGKRVDITTKNTTLFAGDRDMFVFLCDEENRVTLPNRRNGQSGTLARGFFVTNSEVGAGVLGIKTFLFDYVCCNRIVWGAHELEDIRIRHTASAPDRFLEEAVPALLNYSRAESISTQATLERAQAAKIDKVDAFLAKRFGPRVGERINAAHVADEGRPIETLWDAVTGATAYARSIPWQADRVAMEEQAGLILDMA